MDAPFFRFPLLQVAEFSYIYYLFSELLEELKQILHYLKPHWRWAVLSPVCVATEVVAELFQPHIMSVIVNEGILAGDSSVIYTLGVRMVVVVLIGMLGGLLSIFAAGTVSYRMGADLRSSLFRKIMGLPFRQVDKLQTGSLITRMTTDVQQVQSVVQASMRLLFRSPILFVGAVSMMLMIHLRLSSILLVILPLLIFIVAFILKRAFPQFLAIQQRVDRQNTIVQEYVSGIRVVKSHVNEAGEYDRFKQNNDDLVARSLRVTRWVVLLGPAMSLLLNIGIAVIVYYGAILLGEGEVNVGDIMACVNYMAQILLSLMMGSRIIMSMTEASASMRRIDEVLLSDGESVAASDSSLRPADEAICFDHLAFSYEEDPKGAREVLSDLSFSINKGETLAIVGGTGSGKSTVASLLARFYYPSAGHLCLNGKDIASYDEESLRRCVGMVMQETLLFHGTLRDNLSWGNLSANDEDMLRACEKAQIRDFVEAQPEGLGYVVSQKGLNLSGGQRQRFSIARTLLGQHEILVLDDCLSAIDLQTEAKIRRALNDIKATKVIISQRMSSIRHADKILVLEQGKLLGCGTHEELYVSCSLYKEMCDRQRSE